MMNVTNKVQSTITVKDINAEYNNLMDSGYLFHSHQNRGFQVINRVLGVFFISYILIVFIAFCTSAMKFLINFIIMFFIVENVGESDKSLILDWSTITLIVSAPIIIFVAGFLIRLTNALLWRWNFGVPLVGTRVQKMPDNKFHLSVVLVPNNPDITWISGKALSSEILDAKLIATITYKDGNSGNPVTREIMKWEIPHASFDTRRKGTPVHIRRDEAFEVPSRNNKPLPYNVRIAAAFADPVLGGKGGLSFELLVPQ